MKTLIAITLAAGVNWMAGAAPTDTVKGYEARSITYTGGEYTDHEYKFRVLTPAQVEDGKKYPVVLFLHGAGERGDDNVRQLAHMCDWMAKAEQREKFPCYLVAPQCPNGKMWIEAHWGRKTHAMSAEPTHEMKMALAALDSVLADEADHVDLDRVYVTGLSMGGYGTWDLAARYPERWAAAVPICGGGDEAAAKRLVGLPIWAWHGDADGAVSVNRSRNMIEAIKQAGGEPKYTELEGVGHNSWDPAYEGEGNIWPWLFEQKRGGK